LREEVSTIVQTEGWTKEAIDKMRKLDSFVKETQRLHGGDAGMSAMLPYLTVLTSNILSNDYQIGHE
jgi:hypothetical protein